MHPNASPGAVTLEFVNDSTDGVGAIFHVYDKLHLDLIPRRYVVEANKSLTGVWTPVAADNGNYNLWVLGPNGYHREFVGNLNEKTAAANPEIQVCYQPCDSASVSVKLHNKGSQPCTFSVAANAYHTDGPWTATVAAGAVGELSWPVTDSGNWYDFTVSASTAPTFKRRFAGRIETGKDSVSDPAMGTGA
jgi:phospholipase C